MRILAVRHGETDWNLVNRVQGSTDNPLNARGLEQGRRTGESLRQESIDRIYSSDLVRARQTAEQIVQALDWKGDIQITPALREQNFGIWEGVPRDDPEYQKEKHQYFKRFENGESFLDVSARVYPFLDGLIEEAGNEETILLCAHGGILRMIASYFSDLNNEEFAGYFAKNCEAAVFEIDKETFLTSSLRRYQPGQLPCKNDR